MEPITRLADLTDLGNLNPQQHFLQFLEFPFFTNSELPKFFREIRNSPCLRIYFRFEISILACVVCRQTTDSEIWNSDDPSCVDPPGINSTQIRKFWRELRALTVYSMDHGTDHSTSRSDGSWKPESSTTFFAIFGISIFYQF